MQITGVSKITINSCICSDHFEDKAYHQTDGNTSLRRLIPNAVPSIALRKEIPKDSSLESAAAADQPTSIVLSASNFSSNESSVVAQKSELTSIKSSTLIENVLSSDPDNFNLEQSFCIPDVCLPAIISGSSSDVGSSVNINDSECLNNKKR